MNKYVGKICPYCKGVINEADEIVVCSVCDMPHHKECWIDNRGCTTFGCTGTISAPNDEDTANEEDFEIILYDEDIPASEQYECCPKCGARNIEGSTFCRKCGNGLRQTESSLSPGPNLSAYYAAIGMGRRSYRRSEGTDLGLLIGQNSGYYVPKFEAMTQRGKKISWNWSAFLITPYWMIYRKMYGYGAAVLGGLFLLSLFGGWLIYLLRMAVYIVIGILGNYIYMNSLTAKAVRLNSLSGQYKNDFIIKNGGTNCTAAILSAIGYALAVTIIRLA